jgi:hypothetical protein
MVRLLATRDTQFEKRCSIRTRNPSELAHSDNASDIFGGARFEYSHDTICLEVSLFSSLSLRKFRDGTSN